MSYERAHERAYEKCPVCGSRLFIQNYSFNGENFYVLVFCSNPKCPYVKPIMARGRIPREIAARYFPGHEEVF